MRIGDLIRIKKTPKSVGIVVRIDKIRDYDSSYFQYWTRWEDGHTMWVGEVEAEVISESRRFSKTPALPDTRRWHRDRRCRGYERSQGTLAVQRIAHSRNISCAGDCKCKSVMSL